MVMWYLCRGEIRGQRRAIRLVRDLCNDLWFVRLFMRKISLDPKELFMIILNNIVLWFGKYFSMFISIETYKCYFLIISNKNIWFLYYVTFLISEYYYMFLFEKCGIYYHVIHLYSYETYKISIIRNYCNIAKIR